MYCNELREVLDSYISDELLVETNHEVLSHLENCPACRSKMAERRSLRQRIRHTVKNAPENQIDPAFAVGLRSQLRETALRPAVWSNIWNRSSFFNMRAGAIGLAGLIILIIGAMFILDINQRSTNKAGIKIPQADNIEVSVPAEPDTAHAIQASWNELASKAVGDHKNCAVEFHLTGETAIGIDKVSAGKDHAGDEPHQPDLEAVKRRRRVVDGQPKRGIGVRG